MPRKQPKSGAKKNAATDQNLSRRERQIMDVVYALGEADVEAIRAQLPDAPGGMAIRRMLAILEEKGQVKRRKEGRKFIYMPRQNQRSAGRKALDHLLDTFFGGSVEEALTAHLERPGTKLSDQQLDRLARLIHDARNDGRRSRDRNTTN